MKKLILFALAISLTACQQVEEACTDDARSSVSVEVVNDAGEDILDAVVQFDSGSGLEDCQGYDGVFACGTEIDGEIDIIASAPGYEDQTVTVTVESDECHVITKDLRVDLVEVTP